MLYHIIMIIKFDLHYMHMLHSFLSYLKKKKKKKKIFLIFRTRDIPGLCFCQN